MKQAVYIPQNIKSNYMTKKPANRIRTD